MSNIKILPKFSISNFCGTGARYSLKMPTKSVNDVINRAIGGPAGTEGESLPRHAAHGGGAGRGRHAPARAPAVPPPRRAGRARAPLPRPV